MLSKLLLLIVLTGLVTGFGTTPGCGNTGGYYYYAYECYCQWEPYYYYGCGCWEYEYVCYYCKDSMPSKPTQAPDGFHIEERGGKIVAVPDGIW